MIQVEHLTRRYDDFIAVNDVSFSIGRGEIVGLLGHNGAGKTTIMKMLTGFLEPTTGQIRIDDQLVNGNSQSIKTSIGYLPENCPVWPEMTVIDYLDYQAALHGVRKADRQKAIIQAIQRTALKEKAGALINTLSRGYRQRVGVAQAILHNPAIVILDEPTNGLDPTQIRHMRELILELAKTSTVIVSTHILQEVQAVCERVLIMRSGKLVIDSRIDDLQQSRALIVAVNQDASQLLQSIGGINSVTRLENKGPLFQFRLETNLDAAPQIASSLTNAGIALFELKAEQQDLETVFARVNNEIMEESIDV